MPCSSTEHWIYGLCQLIKHITTVGRGCLPQLHQQTIGCLRLSVSHSICLSACSHPLDYFSVLCLAAESFFSQGEGIINKFRTLKSDRMYYVLEYYTLALCFVSHVSLARGKQRHIEHRIQTVEKILTFDSVWRLLAYLPVCRPVELSSSSTSCLWRYLEDSPVLHISCLLCFSSSEVPCLIVCLSVH